MRVVAAVAAAALVALGGCAVAQSVPPPPRPFGEIVREDKGVVVSVNDTTIDLRTGMGRGMTAHSPGIPVGRVAAISLPVMIGGEKKREMPAEEITVRLPSGKLVLVVQERSNPPIAPEEQVLVQYERGGEGGTQGRMRVVRE